MRVAKILGAGGAIPFEGKSACSQIVYINDSDFVLVDAGFGIAQSLSTSGESYNNLSAIFITHYHADHICDLPTILFTYFLNTHKKSIKIFIPKADQGFILNLFFEIFAHLPDTIKMVNGFIPNLELIPFTGETTTMGEVEVSSLPMKHGTIETFGLSFVFPKLKLAISSDTTYCDSLISLVKNCDILIQDCAFSDDFGPNPLHIVPSQIITLIENTSIQKVYLNHLMPETKGKEVSIVKSIKEKTKIDIQLAFHGHEINM